jgi:hypothetical protein
MKHWREWNWPMIFLWCCVLVFTGVRYDNMAGALIAIGGTFVLLFGFDL